MSDVARAEGFAGEGIDNIIATDHHVHKDYKPTIAALGLSNFVTGTIGGNVYAIPTSEIETASVVKYVSPDLGWNVIGMDAGQLDGDPEDEVVVGTWIDDGSYDDWDDYLNSVSGADKKNRGGLYILDADMASGTWVLPLTRLDADDLAGLPARGGIGSGVFGVKIDDVDADGTAEIWASDATGHIYLFRKDGGGQWTTFFRSADLAPYPGIFNNIYPVKNSAGKTKKLIVVSSGYIMAFKVKQSMF